LLDGLLVARNHGLGGRAVSARSPVSVIDYRRSPVISHAYDQQVCAEGLVSLVAVPVFDPDDRGLAVRAVLYGAMRHRGRMGDTVVDALVDAAGRLGRVVFSGAPAGTARTSEGGCRPFDEVFAEIRSAADRLRDPVLRSRILELCERRSEGAVSSERPQFSPRELEVLTLVAAGCSNDMIADLLGTSADAVKAHLRTAMRRLRAKTRHAAVSEARACGLIA
jgi:LuxR family transcriptional regulator, regulator of acetate metabolism